MDGLFVMYTASVLVGSFLNFGTAYRYTKHGGNNGAALFGWMLALNTANLLPGLCIYLWHKARKAEAEQAEAG